MSPSSGEGISYALNSGTLAGRAIADVVKETELSANYIVPTVFNPNVVTAVAEAVEKVARASMEL